VAVFEAYNQATFYENGIKHEFIQDNQSFSKEE
jgi:dTDP-4-dehydrorhamnose 3,5-epimerase-like enzyme